MIDIEKQTRKELQTRWWDRWKIFSFSDKTLHRFDFFFREMFVDKNRAVAVVMGEKDNKTAIDKRKKTLVKEKMKYGVDEEVELSWSYYYSQVLINARQKLFVNESFYRLFTTFHTKK